MNRYSPLFGVVGLWAMTFAACRSPSPGPSHDRPFPIGHVSDSFWEAQQTNAEAADFIFHLHEFVGETAELAPSTRKHLESVALRLEHVPFPVVVEETGPHARPELDAARRRTIVEHLAKMGVPNAAGRVVAAPAYVPGFTAVEGDQAFGASLGGGAGGGGGGRFGGSGGTYR